MPDQQSDHQEVQLINELLSRHRQELTDAVLAAMPAIQERAAETRYQLHLAAIADRLETLEWSWLMYLGTLHPKAILFGQYLVEQESVLFDYDIDENGEIIRKALANSKALTAVQSESGIKLETRRDEVEGRSTRIQLYFVKA